MSFSISLFGNSLTVIKIHYTLFLYLPKVLCIDEFKSVTSHLGKMSFICIDGLTHRIIDVLPSRQLDHLITYFKQFSKKARHSVRYLVMDMNANYGKLIRK
ncbi:transposase, partial [Granulicatella sp. zg-ZJ]|uniref:transposase n=1 Tax=Granulicatella sp. zg-ZJ TaxID=2678504 RepID=UPI00351B07FC